MPLRLLLLFSLLLLGFSVAWGQGAPFTPNDPYFFTGTPTGFPGQWHLDKQTSGALIDANVSAAWAAGFTGQGVTIGVVEGAAFDATHPDLAPNYVAELSTGGTDFDYTRHPTSVAGIVGARGGNGIGVTGVAPYANLAAIGLPNLGYGPGDHAAGIYHRNDAIKVKTSSVAPNITYFPTYTAMPEIASALAANADAGGVYVSMAGNYRTGGTRGNSSSWGWANSPNQIVVGGVAPNGTFASYSSWGPNLTVSSPTGVLGPISPPNSIEQFGVTTTNYNTWYYPYTALSGDINYTSHFNGTSAATPIVAGVMALAAEAQPALTTRFAKHLLTRTSVKTDLSDSTPMGGWTTNAVGVDFNNNYGFGVIDAKAVVDAAQEYVGVTPLAVQSIPTIAVGQSVPIGDPNGLVATFDLANLGPLEEIQIRVRRAGVSMAGNTMELISPSGTANLLFGNQVVTTAGAIADVNWTYLSNAFWGENPAGTWQLKITNDPAYDPNGITTFELVDFSVTARSGSLIAAQDGDFNADGVVDGSDFLKWQRTFGSSLNLAADDNHDGVVDALDLAIWKEQFAGTLEPAASVPEPSSVALLSVALITLTASRRIRPT